MKLQIPSANAKLIVQSEIDTWYCISTKGLSGLKFTCQVF